jgi:hypothetical protein
VFPRRIANVKSEEDVREINLLYLEASGGENRTGHFVAITNLLRLVRKQLRCQKSATQLCKRCLSCFRLKSTLERHTIACNLNRISTVETVDPEKNRLRFRNYGNLMPVPFYIVADFEALLKPCNRKLGQNTKALTHQTPSGFGFIVRSTIPEYDDHSVVVYRGPDAATVFLQRIEQEIRKIMRLVRCPKPLQMTEEDKKNFQNATMCECCHVNFDNSMVKCRDHCNQRSRNSNKYRPGLKPP